MSEPSDARALSEAEVEDLLGRYRATGSRHLRNRVVEAHLDLAEFQVRRYGRGAVASSEDLRQTALMAIIHAAERFEPDHGASFRTFASRTIEGELKRYLRDRSWAVRPPRGRQELHLRISRCAEELSHELGRSPTVPELAERLDVSPDLVLEGMEAGNARVAEHLDPGPRSEDNGPLASALGAVDPSYDAFESHVDLGAALERLDEREREVLRLRFVAELNQPEIADALGISQSYVSRLLRGALARLRHTMEADNRRFGGSGGDGLGEASAPSTPGR